MPLLANSAARLISLGLLVLLLNKQTLSGLFLFLIPLVYMFYKHPEPARQILLLGRRLRWFFLSIIVLYFWFYPGVELLPFLGNYSPALEGVLEAGLRISSLLIIISYSVFFLNLTPRGEVVAAIQYILTPLSFLGINSDRFALRLGLVLSIVPELAAEKTKRNKKKSKKMSEIIDQAAEMVKRADSMASIELIDDMKAVEMKRAGFLDFVIPFTLLTWLLAI